MEKEKLTRKKIFGFIQDYFIITLGLFIYTSGWIIFMLPNGLLGGGVSGIGAIIQYSTGFPMSYSFFIINFVLLLIGLKVLGKGFGAKTVYAIFMASILYKVVPSIYPAEFISEFAIQNGKLICVLIAGAMSGVGIGITFGRGGSTGGTDIIALVINKYRNIAPGKIILLMDIVIIASILIIPTESSVGELLANILYGYIMIAACGFTIDLVISGAKQSVQVFIFSKEYKDIADVITSNGRGVTVISGEGWYTKKEGKILMVIARKTELTDIFKSVKQIDAEAFLSVGNVMGVYGKGFDKIRK